MFVRDCRRQFGNLRGKSTRSKPMVEGWCYRYSFVYCNSNGGVMLEKIKLWWYKLNEIKIGNNTIRQLTNKEFEELNKTPVTGWVDRDNKLHTTNR